MEPIVISFGNATPNFHKAVREAMDKLLHQVDSAANPMEEGLPSSLEQQAVHEVTVLGNRIVDLAMGFDALQPAGSMVDGEVQFVSRSGRPPTVQVRMGPAIPVTEPNDG